MSDGIIYSRTNAGHKVSYALTLESLYGFRTLHGNFSLPQFATLVRARNLIFSTLDDAYFTFWLVALVRWLTGKRTSALFLRPQTCVAPKTISQRAKNLIFRAIRRFGIANTMVIVPFAADPRYAQLACDWVHDPEFWDLDLKLGGKGLPGTPLSEDVVSKAAGRTIVVLFGALTARKGLAELVAAFDSDPTIAERTFFVSAGRIDPKSAGLAEKFTAAGSLATNRFVTDEELFSLYGVADYVWAAYAPEYDQSSGSLGRALQLRLPVIVREGSLVQKLAEEEQLKVVALPFDNPAQTRACLAALADHRRTGRAALVDRDGNETRRRRFVDAMNRGLQKEAHA